MGIFLSNIIALLIGIGILYLVYKKDKTKRRQPTLKLLLIFAYAIIIVASYQIVKLGIINHVNWTKLRENEYSIQYPVKTWQNSSAEFSLGADRVLLSKNTAVPPKFDIYTEFSIYKYSRTVRPEDLELLFNILKSSLSAKAKFTGKKRHPDGHRSYSYIMPRASTPLNNILGSLPNTRSPSVGQLDFYYRGTSIYMLHTVYIQKDRSGKRVVDQFRKRFKLKD